MATTKDGGTGMSSALENGPEQSPPVTTNQDDLEHTLLQAHSLIESAVLRYRAYKSRDLAVDILPSRFQATVTELVGNVQRELVSMVPQHCMLVNLPDTANDVLSRLDRKDVRVRLLCSPANIETVREQYGLVISDELIRLAECPPMALMIVDGNSALIRSRLSDRQAIILHDPAIVNSLYTLFNSAWTLASSAMNRSSASDRELELERRILTVLDRGQTDEAAAREIGISVRTYRRHVAKIMQDLGASSRFQAGARASKFRLIDTEYHGRPTTTRGRR
jgi:DNA-binding CsgD family transcriptional regulator